MITSMSCDVFMGTAGGLREGGKEEESTDFRQAKAKKLRKDPGGFRSRCFVGSIGHVRNRRGRFGTTAPPL